MDRPESANRVIELAPDQFSLLAASLGDSPETTISHYQLTSRTCRAWCVGDPRQPRAAIVQADGFPAEPSAFGWSGEDIARMLPFVDGWECINIPAHLLPLLERSVANLAGTDRIRTLEDIYFVQDGPLPSGLEHHDVRLLTDNDALYLADLQDQLGRGLQKPIVAAGFHEEELVSVAHTFAWSPGYVDLGVTTHESVRNQGLATAAAALVCAEVRKRGRIPVWSTGATNQASLRVAEKLGFREISRRVYVIPEATGDTTIP